MKRDEHIMPLSRDHHFGLLFCWKIRQGLDMNVDPERIKRYIVYYRDHHFRQHFHEEETILFVLEEDAYCRRAKEEHRQIERLIKDIEAGDADAIILRSLADLVDNHIRYEERELFPYLEKTLTAGQLSAIGTELHRLHAGEVADNYEDEFWVKPDK